MPGSDLPGIDIPYMDKLVHIGIFLVLTVLWALSLDPRGIRSKGFTAFLFIALLLYGMVIEFLQYALIDSRSADPADLMANLLGILFGLLVAGLLRKRVGLKV